MEKTLNSWKEVAQFLGRSVRTVQRWERDFGLPVRRPSGHDKAAIVAMPTELKAWVRRAPSQRDTVRSDHHERFQRLRSNTQLLLQRTQNLAEMAKRLQDELARLAEQQN